MQRIALVVQLPVELAIRDTALDRDRAALAVDRDHAIEMLERDQILRRVRDAIVRTFAACPSSVIFAVGQVALNRYRARKLNACSVRDRKPLRYFSAACCGGSAASLPP